MIVITINIVFIMRINEEVFIINLIMEMVLLGGEVFLQVGKVFPW